MTSPFKFGIVVSGDSFTNRTEELKKLIQNFEAGINSIIISPRKWGKSSLVKKAADQLCQQNLKIKFCFIDLFSIRSEEQFYKVLTKEIIKATTSKPEEIILAAKTFLKKLNPKISFGADPANDFQFSFNISQESKDYEEVINLPEKVAVEKKIKIIICIDEFQNLAYFDDPLLFQKRLRSLIQYHQHTSYCFYGSKRDMMINIFNNKSMPFYKFGDLILLNKIDLESLSNFICFLFEKSGKAINIKHANKICELMECHPYYVQQLAHIIWINTAKIVDNDIINASLNELIDQNSLLFEKEAESMNNTQIRFLISVCQGITEGHTRKEILNNYKLGTSANAIKIRKALQLKEVIDIQKQKISFLDPAFKIWFIKNYLG